MAYDNDAKNLGVKAIGTVESNMDYGAINYNDPITVGFVQWYGTRAANVLNRMRRENTPDWKGVATSIQYDLVNVASSDSTFWTSRYLTTTEGSSLVPVLNNNELIQNDQLKKDMEDYKAAAISYGMDPDAYTKNTLFFFTIYHQSPQSAIDVLSSVGAGATLEAWRDGALAHPVVGAYVDRQNTVYDILLAGDSSGVKDPPETDPGTTDPVDTGNGEIAYVQRHGNALLVHMGDGQRMRCVPSGHGYWLPFNGAGTGDGGTTDPEDPTDPPDPGTGAWSHPLPGAVITSPYGPRSFDGYHYGCDWSSSVDGKPVLAVTEMKIVQAVTAGTGPYDASEYVKGQTTDGKYTFCYYHMVAGSIKVRVGQVVPAGTELAIEGATGNAFGRHLHLECYDGRYRDPYYSTAPHMDPVPVLQANGITV